jgi:hypothetical protein
VHHAHAVTQLGPVDLIGRRTALQATPCRSWVVGSSQVIDVWHGSSIRTVLGYGWVVSARASRSHLCPVTPSASGLIDGSWCFDRFGKRLVDLPPIRSEADVARPELLLAQAGRLKIYYCPFDYVNPLAKVVIVGITPGLHQGFYPARQPNRPLLQG